ncbi:GTPase Era [Pelomicrobium sp. G1]|uniref:GTPase Era n=1 Tax=unclassified Pelomicrobium TaxID=2815318 RepID=UPI000B125632
MSATAPGFRSGYVAIVGRPNVGKSTLLNCLVGAKISIVSPRPQTTRHRVRGILTTGDAQLVFVDTPGFQTLHGGALNRALNRSVVRTLEDVDVTLVVVEALRFNAGDRQVVGLLKRDRPAILAINKVDLVKDKGLLLPFIQQAAETYPFAEIVPVSAEKGAGVEDLVATIRKYLPEGPPLYDPGEMTDASERFLAAELLREKLFRLLGEELPYATTVVVEEFKDEGDLKRIHAVVYVEKDSQKAIVIGRKGEKLKEIASLARLDMERLFGTKVFLDVWVKVRRGWSDDERMLKSLGFES